MTCITGVSGSGKSTLINNTLYELAAQTLNGAQTDIAPFKKVKGMNLFDKVVNINQSPIGRTPRSNPATYTGVFTLITRPIRTYTWSLDLGAISRVDLVLMLRVEGVKPAREMA